MSINRLISLGIRAATAKQTWEATVTHPGLNKTRSIRGTDKNIVNQKANALIAQWDSEWEAKVEREKKRIESENYREEKRRALESKALAKQQEIAYKEMLAADAIARTKEAQDVVNDLRGILSQTLEVDDCIDWDKLKDTRQFPKSMPIYLPIKPPVLAPPIKPVIPPEPKEYQFAVEPGSLERILPFLRGRRVEKSREAFKSEHDKWVATKTNIESDFKAKMEDFLIRKVDTEECYGKKSEEYERKYAAELEAYQKELYEFTQEITEKNLSIDKAKADYIQKVPEAIQDYCEMVLANSKYPDNFPQQYDLEYSESNKTLIVDYSLPSMDSMPTLKEVRFLKTKNDFQEIYFTEKEMALIYDDVLYKVALRTIHELFEADAVNALDAVVFNGFVTAMDKSVGHEVTACIMSLQAQKDEFMAIKEVDPSSWTGVRRSYCVSFMMD